MQDVENDIEIFRYDESLSVEDLKKSPEVYGLPTLYLPNRLANGVLKVSDATYHFPLNDPLGNHIHGFLHKREHTLVSAAVDGKKAIAKTEYIYDKNDEFSRHTQSASRQSSHLLCPMTVWSMHLQ